MDRCRGYGKRSRIWQDKLHAAVGADTSPTAAFSPNANCQIQKGFSPFDF
jgi:hypothetical protein